MAVFVESLDTFGKGDVDFVNGKNASLGEKLRAPESAGVRVSDGVAVTVDGYRAFNEHDDLDLPITETVEGPAETDDRELASAGETIRTAADSR